MRLHKTYLGYWYQRTTLHLSEIYDFLTSAKSPLWLDQQKLREFRDGLRISEVRLRQGVLETIEISAEAGIEIKIYEDGLVLLSKQHSEIKHDIKQLTNYFETKFSPAISYIFSLGAPVPKELANIKTAYPYILVTSDGNKAEIAKLLSEVGENEYFEIKSGHTEIYRGNEYYVLNSNADLDELEELIGMLVFFREFKSQLHHYLNLHRAIWEKIEAIKEQKQIKGKDVGSQRAILESYKKTVELIEGRINQMGVYIETRSALVEKNNWGAYLRDILEFRYDNLDSTLNYVKSIWSMTKQYLNSAIHVFSDINSLSTRNSVQALTIISSIGVVAGVMNYLTQTEFPKFSGVGIVYFAILIGATLAVNQILKFAYRHISYKIADIKLAKIGIDRKL